MFLDDPCDFFCLSRMLPKLFGLHLQLRCGIPFFQALAVAACVSRNMAGFAPRIAARWFFALYCSLRAEALDYFLAR